MNRKRITAGILSLCVAAGTMMSPAVVKQSLMLMPVLAAEETESPQKCGSFAEWSLSEDGKTMTISGVGEMYAEGNDCSWESNDAICKTVETVIVESGITSISTQAFKDFTVLSSVSLPDTIRMVGYKAFPASAISYEPCEQDKIEVGYVDGWAVDCKGQNINNTIIYLKDSTVGIAAGAFKLKNFVNDIEIPDSVAHVAADAFTNTDILDTNATESGLYIIDGWVVGFDSEVITNEAAVDCSSCKNTAFGAFHAFADFVTLPNFIVPDTLTEVGGYYINGCTGTFSHSGMAEFEAMEDLTYLGYGAFYDTDLTSVTIPDGVTYVGPKAFYECAELTDIVIPDHVTHIDSEAFGMYSGGESLFVTLSDTEKHFGEKVFAAQTGETRGCVLDITCNDGVIDAGQYRGQSITSVMIGDGITSIEDMAFAENPELTSVQIPNSVTSIADNTFAVSASDSTANYGDVTIYCRSGSYAHIYAQEKGIPYYLTDTGSVSTPSGTYENLLYTIETDYQTQEQYICITGSTEEVAELEIPAEIEGLPVTAIKYYAFANQTSLESITLPDTLTSIGTSAFEKCTTLTSVVIPDSVTYLADCVFCGCTSLTSVTLPETLTTMAEAVFMDCTALETIDLPDNLEYIAGGAFMGCTALHDLVLPDSVEYIAMEAFADCTSLTEITIPAATTNIETMPFVGCTSLTAIHVAAENTRFVSDDGVLYNYDHSVLYSYPAARPASSFTIPEEVTTLGQEAFSDAQYLKEIIVPEGMAELRSFAFRYCTSLESISLPSTLETIGLSAFEECVNLKTIVIPESLTEIKSYAFQNCTALQAVQLPETDITIGDYNFDTCENVTIYGTSGTSAETYAAEKAIPFVDLSAVTAGNLNGDDAINASDAASVLIAAAAVGAGSDSGLLPVQKASADLNGDGAFNASDAAVILQYAAYVGSGNSGTIEEFLDNSAE